MHHSETGRSRTESGILDSFRRLSPFGFQECTDALRIMCIVLGCLFFWGDVHAASTVGTTTSTGDFGAHRRFATYTNGYYWVVFWDGTDAVIYSSADGSSWASQGALFSNAPYSGGKFALKFTNNYVYGVFSTQHTGSGKFRSRRVALNSNGTITGKADVIAAPSSFWRAFSTNIDSAGYPIAFMRGADGTYEYDIWRNSATDMSGTWNQLGSTQTVAAVYYRLSVFPADDSQDVYTLFYRTSTVASERHIRGQKWDNSGGSYDAAVGITPDASTTFNTWNL